LQDWELGIGIWDLGLLTPAFEWPKIQYPDSHNPLPNSQILHYLCTMASIRQEKFARLLQRDLSNIIQQRTHSYFEGKMLMVNDVEVSPDLGYAKIYLGFINQAEKDYLLGLVQFYSKEIRHELAQKIRNEVRKIPELTFYIDNTLDNALKMEKILEKLKENDELK